VQALITGGAGFIGSNLARRLLEAGHEVTLLDDASRPGARRNLESLSALGDTRLHVVEADVRDVRAVRHAVSGTDVVFHLAAQVAVTTSLLDPVGDFDVNLRGTLNVLEAIRSRPDGERPAVLFTSTNKVYGRIEDVPVVEQAQRYAYAGGTDGIGEGQRLDFHSPYGCSKGAADQYVREYARVYGLRTVVFRMSCIYGPRQWGTEDQGWVAHFLISAALGRPITVYGDGKQVRDVLFIDDLLDACLRAVGKIDSVAGEVFNIGGGPENTLSLLELLEWLERRLARPVARSFAAWRPGDQRVYVSDISRARERLGWAPRVTVASGLERLWQWVDDHRGLFAEAAA